MPDTPSVRELRLVVTAADYDEALRFYREVLGLTERAGYCSPRGRVTILEAGRATLELADPPHAGYVDEVEVGQRVAGHIRVAIEVPDSRVATAAAEAAGARVLAPPTRTPWDSLNARIEAPAGLQLTLFTELRDPAEPVDVPADAMDAMDPAADVAADAVDAAQAAAADAARRYGVRVVELREVAAHHEAARLLARVWRTGDGQDPLTAETVRALAHSGNYVAGAFDGDRLVGTAIAFYGGQTSQSPAGDSTGPRRRCPAGHLHSHIAGVEPDRQDGGVGYALKQHQRAWALARGITQVHWTFDPLIRRNAYFNLHKLGATATAYLPDFYGAMTDGINVGDASDRLYLRWHLTSPQAVAAAAGTPAGLDVAAARAAGATVLLDRAGDTVLAERPVPGAGMPTGGRPALVAVPTDIEAIRRADRALGTAWRMAVRKALTRALATGYRIVGVSRDGYYMLSAPPDGGTGPAA